MFCVSVDKRMNCIAQGGTHYTEKNNLLNGSFICVDITRYN